LEVRSVKLWTVMGMPMFVPEAAAHIGPVINQSAAFKADPYIFSFAHGGKLAL
jgi:hypothetical protein